MGRINDLLVLIEPFSKKMFRQRTSQKESWMVCCPAHEDSSPSLAITECHDGRLLMYCHAGCSNEDVLYSIGKVNNWHEPDMMFLAPDSVRERRDNRVQSIFGPRPRHLRTLDDHLTAVAAADRKSGRRLTEAEKLQEFEAFKRIQERGY